MYFLVWDIYLYPRLRFLCQDFPLDDFDKQMEWLKEGKFILSEAEVVFDAADAVRFGKDIFVTLTHVSRV